MKDFAVQLGHRPGELARVANALGKAGVNLKSVAALTVGSQALVRFIADDVEAARGALRDANIRFDESDVTTILLENKAGEVAEVATKLSNAGVNLLALYVVGLEGDLVELALAVDDLKKAKKALE